MQGGQAPASGDLSGQQVPPWLRDEPPVDGRMPAPPTAGGSWQDRGRMPQYGADQQQGAPQHWNADSYAQPQGQDQYGQPGYDQAGYDQPGYDPYARQQGYDPYGDAQNPYGQPPQGYDQYGQQQAYDQYGQPAVPYGQQQNGDPYAQGDPYGQYDQYDQGGNDPYAGREPRGAPRKPPRGGLRRLFRRK